MSRVHDWLAAFFTRHNMLALARLVGRAALTGAEAASGQIPAAIDSAADAVSAAKSIHVNGFEPRKPGSGK